MAERERRELVVGSRPLTREVRRRSVVVVEDLAQFAREGFGWPADQRSRRAPELAAWRLQAAPVLE